MSGHTRHWIGLSIIALLIVACSPPTADEATDESSPAPTDAEDEAAGELDNSAALEEVYAAVEGLTGEERSSALAALAAEEDGLNVYSSTNLDDAAPLLEAFTDAYDIEPNYYRASSSDVLRRILQEADANFPGNDVVLANGPEMALLDGEGLLLPLNSPATEDIIEAGVFETWASVYMNTFTAAWNTNTVTDPPPTWEDLLTNFDGNLVMELGDWDWFATLTNQYFIAELGMTEEEAVDLLRQAAAGARVVDGHTLMAELLVAGEFDAGTSFYHHRIAEFVAEGAPVHWSEPQPIQPLIIRPNGTGIMRGVQNPATALLWTEFLLTDAQEILAADYRGPASTAVEGGVPPEYEPILVDIDAITQEREKWEGLWAEIVEASGSEIVSD